MTEHPIGDWPPKTKIVLPPKPEFLPNSDLYVNALAEAIDLLSKQPRIPKIPDALKQEGYLSLSEAAKLLRVSKAAVVILIKERGLPAVKLGKHWRFRRQWIDGWMDGRLDSE